MKMPKSLAGKQFELVLVDKNISKEFYEKFIVPCLIDKDGEAVFIDTKKN